MASNDEWFEECIEYDVDSESVKENAPVNPVITIKQPKTTKKQFDKIAAFMNEDYEEGMDKDTINLLWEDLAAKLNDLGPPDHTVTEWKRIWSDHKQNAKRKRSIESDVEHPEKIIRLATSSGSQAVRNDAVVGLSEISNQLSTIVENQNKMLVNQGKTLVNHNLIIQEMRKSNKLLQELVKKS